MKTTTIANLHTTTSSQSSTLSTRVSHLLHRAAHLLAVLFSFILGERISAAYSLCLLNVMLSGLCAFLFGGASLTIQILLLIWFAVAIWQAKMVSKN